MTVNFDESLYKIRKALPCQLWIIWERVQFIFVLVLAPAIYFFQMFVLFPKLVPIVKAGPIQQCVHIFLASICLVNIYGNVILSAGTDLNIRQMSDEIRHCDQCKKECPAASWHCRKCNICVLRRDHHCTYLGKCVGLNNKRYYLLFLGHVTIAMMYATFYNWAFIATLFEEEFSTLIYIAGLLNPIQAIVMMQPVNIKDIYVLYVFLNMLLGVWTAVLFYHHLKNTAMGVTGYEDKHKPELKNIANWKENLIAVFGTRWYWAVVCPFSSSPLPWYVKRDD